MTSAEAFPDKSAIVPENGEQQTKSLKNLMGAFGLPKRFKDNGITTEVLSRLNGTPAEVDPEDRMIMEQLTEARVTPDNVTVFFNQTGEETGLSDRLATLVQRIEINSDANSPFGFRVDLGIDEDIKTVDLSKLGQDNASAVIKAILSKGQKTFGFELAQQLGHTLAMKGLRNGLASRGIAGIEFAVPNPDNLNLLTNEFADGEALPWRQLFEPGYVIDQDLVFPMNPLHPDYRKTVLLTAMLNKHIIAMSCLALSQGHNVILFNDARHEGPALFKAISDWALNHQVKGKLHTFHMGYLALDPILSLPQQVNEKILRSQRVLSERSKQLFPDTQVADGVEFMVWKMQAQLMLAEEADQASNINHSILYQTSFSPNQLTLDLIPEDFKPWFKPNLIHIIPEVTATATKSDHVKTIVFSLGISGHSETENIITQAVNCASKNPEITIMLLGKGTDSESISQMVKTVPVNMKCLGVVPKDEHDRLLSSADTVITKTSRNSRNTLVPSVLSGQGVILLPPESPQDVPDGISLFELSYLRETLMEHALDLMTALRVLNSLGIKDPNELVWKQSDDLLQLARKAKRASINRAGEVIIPDDLANIVVNQVKK